MTPSEKETLKAKIKILIEAHLASKGWPNANPDLVIQELKPMWVKMEEAGLVVPGMSFSAFEDHARSALMMARISEMMGI